MTSCVASTFNNNQCWYKRTGRWISQIKVNGKRRHLGYFRNENKAAVAYNDALRKLRKERAAAVDVKRKPCTRTLNDVTDDQLSECEQDAVRLSSNAPGAEAPGGSKAS
jgi:hypothetical protein